MHFDRLNDWLLRQKVGPVLTAATALLISAVIIFAVSATARIESVTLARFKASTARLTDLTARRFAETTRQIESLQRIGAILTDATTNNRETDAAVLLTELRYATQQPLSSILWVGAVDPVGRLIWATTPPTPEIVDLSDRDYFLAIARDRQDRFVGGPRVGRVSGKNAIPFTAAFRNSDGSLRAVIIVALNTRALMPLEAGLDFGPEDYIGLFRADGLLLARSKDAGTTTAATDAVLFQKLQQSGDLEDVSRSPFVTGRHFQSMRRVENTRLFVTVSLSPTKTLEPLSRAVFDVEVMAFAVCVAILGMSGLLLGMIRRTRKLREVEAHRHDLELSEGLLRQMATGAPEVIGLQDEKRCWIYANGAVEETLGVSPQALLGQAADSAVAHEDKPRVRRLFDELDMGSGPRRIDVRINKPDGSIAWIEALTSLFVIDRPGGQDVRRYVTVLRDITSQKSTEESLRRAREEIITILQNSPGLLYTIQFQSDGTSNSEPIGGSLDVGYDAEAETARTFIKNRTSPEDFIRRRTAIQACRAEGSAVLEYQLRTQDGDWRWLRDTMNRAETGNGNDVIVGFIADITEERQRKQTMAQTDRLAALGTVATGIAHEVNQPLAVISMAAENGIHLLERHETGVAQAIKKFRRIVEQVDRISQAVTYIRLAGSPGSSIAHPFTIDEAMRGVLMLTGQRLLAAGVVIVTDFEPDLPMIQAPCVLIEHVLINLILNASDAYEGNPFQGLGVVRSVMVKACRDGGMVHIRVADSAGRIAPVIAEHLPDPFGSTKPGDTIRMGLSNSFTTISEAGGRISARSEAGGTVFDIHLPAMLAPG